MVPAHWCLVASDLRSMTTAVRSRRRKPQLALVAGQPVYIHRRKHGAQGWCGPGVCNRTHVRPATNEKAEGIETVASLLLGLTKVVREDARDTTMTRGDFEDDEDTVVESDVMDVRSSTYLPIPTPHHAVPDQNLAVEPESEVALSIGMDMETGASDRRVRFRDKLNMVSIFDPPRQVRQSCSGRVQLAQATLQLESDST